MRWHNVLLLAAAILISGCKEEKLAVGAPAPALAAFDLQGRESGLERWQGKAVYLNFGLRDAGCLAEMDTLEALSKNGAIKWWLWRSIPTLKRSGSTICWQNIR